MRLIDANKIEDYLENVCDNERDAYCLVNLLSYIGEMPIAYDVDEVIRQLSDIVIFQNYIKDIKGIDYDKTIDIIKKGGIENDN